MGSSHVMNFAEDAILLFHVCVFHLQLFDEFSPAFILYLFLILIIDAITAGIL